MEFLKIWEILLRRKWIIISTFFIFVTVVVIGTYIVTPTYKASAKLLIETSDTLSSLMSTLGLQSIGGGFASTSDEYDTEIALVKIKPLLEELISSLQLKDRNKKIMKPEQLVKLSLFTKIFPQPVLKVKQFQDADMLEIVVTSPDPAEAANISNKIAKLYIASELERMREEYKVARIFIQDQIKKCKKDYYNSLYALKEFRIEERTVDLSLESQNLINKTGTLKSGYEDNEKTIIELEKEISEAKLKLKKMDRFRKESEEFKESDLVKNLKAKLSELLIKISEKGIDFTKEHPDYKQLEKEVETVKELIQQEAEVVFNKERFSIDPIHDELSKKLVVGYINRDVAIAKRRLLQKYIDEYENELFKIPIKSVEQSKLELALSVNKDMYKSLLEYMTQVGIAESMTLSNIRLVEPAERPYVPNFPKKNINYFLGIILGLFWGFALAFFVEYIDNTLKSPEDIKRFKSLTLLGIIPRSKYLSKLNLISKLHPTSPIVEAYHTLQNSIGYASIDKPINTILITSSIESEGKSSIASNISIIISKKEKRVVLVDLDLRRPSLHKFFGIPNTSGVTNVLAEGMELKDGIIHTDIERLDLLPSGPIPPDPSRLIESQRLKDIIYKLKEMYDTVVIDSSPAIAVNDAVVLGTIADGIVYIIETGRATFSMVEHVTENIEKAGINLIGVVLNKLKIQRSSYHHYYYNRYYKND